jgi:hypothetical protein
MAERQGMSKSTISNIWRSHNLKPHRVKTFKLSRDPKFLEKLTDVIGLYLNALADRDNRRDFALAGLFEHHLGEPPKGHDGRRQLLVGHAGQPHERRIAERTGSGGQMDPPTTLAVASAKAMAYNGPICRLPSLQRICSGPSGRQCARSSTARSLGTA